MKFNKFEYLKSIEKGQVKMVNLAKVSLKECLSTLSKFAVKLLSACFNKGGSLYRLTVFKMFIQHIYTMKSNHGMNHVVKYLKACQLCIQKCIAGEPVNSLKELAGPGVYPSLRTNLPKFIPKADRSLIRSQNIQIIRFYLTLFSIYRILYIPGTLKLSTITDPFKGSEHSLQTILVDKL